MAHTPIVRHCGRAYQLAKLRLILISETCIFSTPLSIAVGGDCGIDLDLLGVGWKLVRTAGKLDFVADDGYCKVGHFPKRFLGAIGLLLVPGQQVLLMEQPKDSETELTRVTRQCRLFCK